MKNILIFDYIKLQNKKTDKKMSMCFKIITELYISGDIFYIDIIYKYKKTRMFNRIFLCNSNINKLVYYLYDTYTYQLSFSNYGENYISKYIVKKTGTYLYDYSNTININLNKYLLNKYLLNTYILYKYLLTLKFLYKSYHHDNTHIILGIKKINCMRNYKNILYCSQWNI